MIDFKWHEKAHEHYPRLSEMTIDDIVGFIPLMASEHVSASLIEQLDMNYQHGGGWRPFNGFVVDDADESIEYDGDPKLYPLVVATFRSDTIYVYPHSWVRIRNAQGTDMISRMD